MSEKAVRRIFAMGGGGFTMEPGNPLLDRFALSLSPRPRPRICFLPTASGDTQAQIIGFYEAFGDEACEPFHVSLFRLGGEPVQLREVIRGADIVYAGGGSATNMLAIWRAHGLDRLLRDAWRSGVVLCGLSAGSMCWFEMGITKSVGHPEPVPGLGLLPGSNSVHYDGEPDRRPAYLRAVAEGRVPGGYGVEDGVGLLFEGRDLARAVSSREGGQAFHVQRVGDGDASETPLDVEWLGPWAERRRDPPADIAEFRRARAGGSRSRWGS
jgi:peptidase E